MKILHVGLMVNGNNEGLSKALRSKSSKYAEFPVSRVLPMQITNLEFLPDIAFFQIQSDKIGDYKTNDLLSSVVEELKRKGTFVINWNGDIRKSYPSWMDQFPSSINAFTNNRDISLSKRKSTFLQIGIDKDIFKDYNLERNGKDVVFFGNNYGNQFPLGEFRRSAVQAIKSFNHGTYGNYPGALDNLNADPNKPKIKQHKESIIYNTSKIALSISHFKVSGYTSDRLLRAIGSKAFVLCHEYPDMQFENGKHLVTFNTIQEMKEKIQYYLEKPKEREEIALNGYNFVHSNFTYDNMADNIIDIYEQNK